LSKEDKKVKIEGEVIGLNEAIVEQIKPIEERLASSVGVMTTKLDDTIEKEIKPLQQTVKETVETLTPKLDKVNEFAEQYMLQCPACGNSFNHYSWREHDWVCPSDDCEQKVEVPEPKILTPREGESREAIFRKLVAKRIGLAIDEPKEVVPISDEYSKLINDRDEFLKTHMETLRESVWSRTYINELQDSAFAHVESGGKKDEEGKTVPRDLRRLAFKDVAGNIDREHLINALQLLSHTTLSAATKESTRKRLSTAIREYNRENEDAITSPLCGVGGTKELQNQTSSPLVLRPSAAIEHYNWMSERSERLAKEAVESEIEELKETIKTGKDALDKMTADFAETQTKANTLNEEFETLKTQIKTLEEKEIPAQPTKEEMQTAFLELFEEKDEKCPEDHYWNGKEYAPIPEHLTTIEKALLTTRVIKQLFTESKMKLARQTLDFSKKPSKESFGAPNQEGLVSAPLAPNGKPQFGKKRLADFMP